MKAYKIFIVLCLSAIAFCACEDSDREGMSASLEYREITVKEHKLNLRADGTGEKSLAIEANNASWSVESPDEWIHMDTNNGTQTATVRVTTDKYTNPETERNGMIIIKSTVTGWDFADTVFVNQPAAERYAQAAEETYEISAKGGELIIPIESNCDWDVRANENWTQTEKISQTQLKVIVEPTNSIYTRWVTIYLNNSQFRIMQAAPVIEIEQEVYEVPAKGGELIIPVEADVEWNASSNKDWVTLEKINNKQLKAVLKQTMYSSSSEATIYFSLATENSYYNGTIASFKIKQDAAHVTVEQSSYEIPAKGGEQIVNVDANVNWEVASSNYDWLTLEKVSNSQLKVVANPTTSTGNRSATIGLKLPNASFTLNSFTVKQAAGSASVSENRIEINKEAQSVDIVVDANTDWTVEVGNTTWISVSQSKGEAGRTTLTITVDKALNYRSSNVYIKIGNTRVQTIVVGQS